MRRLPGWEQRLAAVVERWRGVPFAWGSADCTVFGSECIEALTGWHPQREFAGRYCDATGADAVLAEIGGLIAWARRHLGPPIGAEFARRGDLLAVRVPGRGIALAPCLGRTAALPGPDGLAQVSRAWARCAWRIG